MQKIIPFKKEIVFKTQLNEITSISLEHSLHKEDDNLITGEFLIKGDYKITDKSDNILPFSYELPFDIHLEEHYNLDNIKVDIDDFYYEIIDENILSVNIDVLLDKLEEKLERVKEVEEVKEVINNDIKLDEYKEVVDNEINNKSDENEANEINSLFDSIDDSETYMTYKVYIVRSEDTLETILSNYNISKEQLELYNDLENLKIGDKLIIPSIYNEEN